MVDLRSLAALYVACLLGCSGQSGTIVIDVLEPPDSGLLARVSRVRATFSNPERVLEVERDAEGELALELELEADGSIGSLRLEGFDEGDALIAVGRTGPLPLSAIDAELAVFMAPPLSVEPSSAELDPPRFDFGAQELSYGAVLVGGRDAAGAVADLDVFSTYLHQFQAGAELPEPLSEPMVMAGSNATVYIVGGRNQDDEPVARGYGFQTSASPAGAYYPLLVGDEVAQAGKAVAPIGRELYFIAGTPALLVDGYQSRVTAVSSDLALEGQAAPVVMDDRIQVFVAGENVASGAALYGIEAITPLEGPAELLRSEHDALLLPSGTVLVLGGSIDGLVTRSAVRFSPDEQDFEVFDLLQTPRRNPGVALTNSYLIVAGGADEAGLPIADVEIFDVETLSLRATLPLHVPRIDPHALWLSNGQVMIVGGRDADGNPIATVEIFTSDE